MSQTKTVTFSAFGGRISLRKTKGAARYQIKCSLSGSGKGLFPPLTIPKKKKAA